MYYFGLSLDLSYMITPNQFSHPTAPSRMLICTRLVRTKDADYGMHVVVSHGNALGITASFFCWCFGTIGFLVP